MRGRRETKVEKEGKTSRPYWYVREPTGYRREKDERGN